MKALLSLFALGFILNFNTASANTFERCNATVLSFSTQASILNFSDFIESKLSNNKRIETVFAGETSSDGTIALKDLGIKNHHLDKMLVFYVSAYKTDLEVMQIEIKYNYIVKGKVASELPITVYQEKANSTLSEKQQDEINSLIKSYSKLFCKRPTIFKRFIALFEH